jgi:carbamoyltransferase
MLQVAPVRKELRCALSEAEQRTMATNDDLRQRINIKRSTIPAVTHVDFSARVQTVDETRNGRYARLLQAFKSRTGCAVLINTSFNVRGEPIVESPADALRCFLNTDMDVLVLEDCVIERHEQTAPMDRQRAAYLASFKPD